MISLEIQPVVEKALDIRRLVLKAAWRAKGGHIAPAYSCADIIATLYFGGSEGILLYNAKNPQWEGRDYFILSKGHGALSLYAALSLAGFFPLEELDSFCSPGSILGSLASIQIPGVEATTGSLGHGLSFALGIALACKADKADNHVYVLVGDGECEEGSIWEALIAANHYSLDNLTIIVDHNGLQAMDSLNTILSFDKLEAKARSFGMSTMVIDGHDIAQIQGALRKRTSNSPVFVVANTVKGKGISFMENVPIWHYRVPDDKEIEIALEELGMERNDLGDQYIKEGNVYI